MANWVSNICNFKVFKKLWKKIIKMEEHSMWTKEDVLQEEWDINKFHLPIFTLIRQNYQCERWQHKSGIYSRISYVKMCWLRSPGTNNNVSEEINVILNVSFKQECNTNLMYVCMFVCFSFRCIFIFLKAHIHYFRSCDQKSRDFQLVA